MTKLEELNKELYQIDEQREIILNKICDENEIEKSKELGIYSYLIGRCFESNFHSNKSHKIININRIDRHGDITINVLMCEPNSIYKSDINYSPNYVTEINLKQFESNLKNTFDNISIL